MSRAMKLLVLCSLALVLSCATTSTQQPPAAGASQDSTQVVVERFDVPKKAPPPESGKRAEVRFPAIARATTASGLELNTVEMHTLPIVKIKLVVKSGSASDPETMPGMADLTAAMLKEGTYKKSSAKLAEAVDFLGAQLNVGSDEDTLVIDFQALTEQLDTALDLVAEVALQPAFSQDELDKLKKRELVRLSLQSQDPQFLAEREFRAALYGKHPYAHVDTTPAVVRRVKRQDLIRWHKRAFVPSNAFLVVTGDVTPERVKAAAERVFGAWKGKPVAVSTAAPTATPEKAARRVIIIDRPESVQSMIYYGNLAIPRGDADFIPLTVANQVLGGSATSRLFMDLREKRSLTYGAYSDVEEHVQVSPFLATAAVRTDVTAEAVAAFTEHLDRIIQEPVAASELADAKRFLTDRFPLRIETAGKIAQLVSELRVFGLPDEYWDRFRGEIEGVTAEAALAAAKRHVRPSESLLVVVGKAAAFKSALEKYGPVTVVDTNRNVLVQAKSQSTAQTATPPVAPEGAAPAPANPVSPTLPTSAPPTNAATTVPAQPAPAPAKQP